MAVAYRYKMNPTPQRADLVEAGSIRDDGTIVRKVLIPESPEEALYDTYYSAEDIDWLHASEQGHIMRTLPEDATLEQVWLERPDSTKVVKKIPLQPAPASN